MSDAAERKAIQLKLNDVRKTTHTPESVGRAIIDQVLEHGLSKGEVKSGKLIVQLEVSLDLPDVSAPTTAKKQSYSSRLCFSMFDLEIACVKFGVEGETTE